MRHSIWKSVAFKRLVFSTSLGFLCGLLTYALGFLPQDDLVQGLWVFLSTSIGAAMSFRKQTQRFEAKEERYKRLAQETLLIKVEEDPHLISTLLLGQDAPERWVPWIEGLLGMDLFKCRDIHAIDSLFHADDVPGQGITRATMWVAQTLTGRETTAAEKEEAVSRALEKLVAESQHILGEQFFPDFYYRHVEKGPLPYGVFMESKKNGALALGTTYRKKVLIRGKTVQVDCARLGLNISLDEKQWGNLVAEIDLLFPCFSRQNLGDGPRSATSQLFIQEKQNVDPRQFAENLKKLPQIIARYGTRTK